MQKLKNKIIEAAKKGLYYNVSTGRFIGKTLYSLTNYQFNDDFNICGFKNDIKFMTAVAFLTLEDEVETKKEEESLQNYNERNSCEQDELYDVLWNKDYVY